MNSLFNFCTRASFLEAVDNGYVLGFHGAIVRYLCHTLTSCQKHFVGVFALFEQLSYLLRPILPRKIVRRHIQNDEVKEIEPLGRVDIRVLSLTRGLLE